MWYIFQALYQLLPHKTFLGLFRSGLYALLMLHCWLGLYGLFKLYWLFVLFNFTSDIRVCFLFFISYFPYCNWNPFKYIPTLDNFYVNVVIFFFLAEPLPSLPSQAFWIQPTIYHLQISQTTYNAQSSVFLQPWLFTPFIFLYLSNILTPLKALFYQRFE